MRQAAGRMFGGPSPATSALGKNGYWSIDGLDYRSHPGAPLADIPSRGLGFAQDHTVVAADLPGQRDLLVALGHARAALVRHDRLGLECVHTDAPAS
jgi:hypothetical protein